MWEVARDLGVDVDAVLATLKRSYAELVDHNARLTPDQGRALARALTRALPDPELRYELGLRAAERFVASDADVLGYLTASTPTALAALHALVKHARLLGDSADPRVIEHAGRVTFELTLLGGRPMVPEGADFAVAAIFHLLWRLTAERVRPIEVRLPRPRPPRTQVYQRFFRGAVVTFGAAAPALAFTRASLLVPLSQRDDKLLRILTQTAETQRRALPSGDDWRDRVRALIANGLPDGDYALDRIAQRCGIGERTLRRRLVEAGTSYRALVDEVRKERALLLLEQAGSVSDVAQRVGFSDATAFARAFRRWTGKLPHQAVRERP
jgi:AraC-like DNA-binding protein